jgi:hypothetical protein
MLPRVPKRQATAIIADGFQDYAFTAALAVAGRETGNLPGVPNSLASTLGRHSVRKHAREPRALLRLPGIRH